MPFDVPVVRAGWLACVLAGCSATSLDLPMEGDGSGGSTTNDPPPTTSPGDTTTTGPGVTSTSGPPPATSGLDTSDTSTGGSGSSSSDDSGTFLVLPDACFIGGPEQGWVSHCSPIECDVFEQDCPRGEKCTPWANDGGNAWNDTRCTPLFRNPVPPGGTCTVEGSGVSGVDDCAAGSMCWGVDPVSLQGTCIQLCDPQIAASCPASSECVAFNQGDVPVCLDVCNPLQGASCPADEACRYAGDDDAFHCLPLDGGHLIESSEHCDGTSCLPSEVCAAAEFLAACAAGSCCTALCDLGDPGADAGCAAIDPMLACEPFFEPGLAAPGLELVGLCIVPS